MENNLSYFFYPKSICIAGASSKPKSIGYELTKCILDYGYTGKLYLVNPKANEIHGLSCYKNITLIKDEIDLAIVLVPKAFVQQSINDLIKINAKAIVLVSAGFKETGAEGEAVEKELVEAVKKAGIRMTGPNCMGLINTLPGTKLNATFVAEKPVTGKSAFVSQSGALCAAVLNSIRNTNINFAHFISIGNKADVSENDLVDFWENDDNIKVTGMYLESFSQGKEFIKKFLDKKITKPVIILKSGKGENGKRAASSHTGALGTNDKTADALMKQAGIIRVVTTEELFNTIKGFESFPSPKSNQGVIVTNAGGPAILCVDELEKCGLNLAQLSDETKEKLKELVHPEGSINNPVDLLPGGDAATYKKVIEVILKDDNASFIISLFVEPMMVSAFNVIEGINSIESEKPVLQVVMPLPEFWNFYNKNSKYKKPLYRRPEDAPQVIKNKLFFYNKSKREERLKKGESLPYLKPGLMNQKDIENLLSTYKIKAEFNLKLNENELNSVKSDMYPVVIKGICNKISHKSDFNLVALNIQNETELKDAAESMRNQLKNQNYDLEYYLIQPYINAKHELLIGGYNDDVFGPVIMFGAGGKYVEYLEDTSIRSAYLSSNDIEEMISSTKTGKIISGVRGELPVDLIELKNLISKFAQMLIDNNNIKEFDANPVLVDNNNKLHLVDLRINIKDNKE